MGKRRTYLQPSEVDALRAACSPRWPSSVRNRLLLECLYQGGLEVAEALELRDADVERAAFDLVRLRVCGRRGSSRWVAIRSELIASDLLPRWRALRPRGATLLFCTLAEGEEPTGFGGRPRAGQALRGCYVRAMVKRLGQRAGLAPALASPRALRRSHAVHAMAEGTDLQELQLRLGHSRLDTTTRYLADTLREATPTVLTAGGSPPR